MTLAGLLCPHRCIVTFKEEFLALHPIFMRRLEFEHHNQASGQFFTDWIAQLKQLGGEADLADVTFEDRDMMAPVTSNFAAISSRI